MAETKWLTLNGPLPRGRFWQIHIPEKIDIRDIECMELYVSFFRQAWDADRIDVETAAATAAPAQREGGDDEQG